MTNRTNRMAWVLAVALAPALLVGVGVLLFAPVPEVAFYRFGIQRGRQDARGGVNLGPDMAVHRPSALLYLQMAPTTIEGELPLPRTPAEKQARKWRIAQASRLADLATSAPAAKQQRYLQRFVDGYRLGQRLHLPRQ